MSHNWYLRFLRSSCICCRSISTVSAAAEAASPWHFICFNPILALPVYRPSHPSLRFSHSSSGIPAKSANFLHFWRRTSPVRRIPSAIAFETHRSSISVTSGCWVWQTRFPERAEPMLSSYSSHHFSSFLHQVDILGCLSQRLGKITSKCFAVFCWFFPLAWCQLRISILCSNVAFSFLVNASLGISFCWLSPDVVTLESSGPMNGLSTNY